jgi:hypothetical protein
VFRYSGLSREQLADWGKLIAIAPFALGAIVLFYVKRRRPR